jgi:STIP1 family protein 1
VCSLLLSNRATCHKALGAWAGVAADARAALRLDDANFRANLLLGEALAHSRLWRFAVARFDRALALAARGGRPRAVVEEVEGALARARASWLEAAAAGEAHADLELAHALGKALQVHYAVAAERGGGAGAWALPTAAEGGEAARAPPYDAGRVPLDAAAEGAALAAAGSGAGGGGSSSSGDGGSGGAVSLQQRLNSLDAVLRERAGRRESRAIPDWACCPVALEVMLDPVATPSGVSFERGAIEACLRSKAEDPLTRAPLTAAQLTPNLGLRAAIAAFLEEHPWAHPRAAGAK